MKGSTFIVRGTFQGGKGRRPRRTLSRRGEWPAGVTRKEANVIELLFWVSVTSLLTPVALGLVWNLISGIESIVGLPGRISEQIAIGVRITW
jgi:hypothetical protein